MQAWALAEAMERRHGEAPFALVQSADFLATGIFVSRRSGRVHAVRCSSSADLYDEADGLRSRREKLRSWLERAAMRRADVTYAPSQFVSDHFRSKYGMKVRVIRPPLTRFAEVAPLPFSTPPRYLLHFGQLMARKGTAHIAKALPIAWRDAPDLTMVWSGKCRNEEDLNAWRAQLGENSGRVIYTGPLNRAQIAQLLQGADAAVLPSMVDNLPNTVIESLAYGVPVIGTRGTSIDEVVEDFRTGHLVEVGDVQALARAMVAVWHWKSPVNKGFVWDGPVARDMDPAIAVRNFVALTAAG
jgi:glycosyltransferase involved in cell wall biosynthesis